LRQFKAEWQKSALGALDMNYLQNVRGGGRGRGQGAGISGQQQRQRGGGGGSLCAQKHPLTPPPTPHARAPQAASPEVVLRAQKHPDFYRMVKEVSDNPSAATMSKWIDHPDIGPLVAAMFKAMQSNQKL